MRDPLPPEPLTGLTRGASATIRSVGPVDAADLQLEGLRPGCRVRISSVAPFGGPVVLDVGRSRIAVARSVAARILVDPA